MDTSAAELSRLRDLSRDLFGEKHLLSVSVVIAQGNDRFNQTQIARRLGVGSSSVQGPLATLVRCGFVTRLEGSSNERAKWLHREPSAYWMLVRELAARVERGPSAQPMPTMTPNETLF